MFVTAATPPPPYSQRPWFALTNSDILVCLLSYVHSRNDCPIKSVMAQAQAFIPQPRMAGFNGMLLLSDASHAQCPAFDFWLYLMFTQWKRIASSTKRPALKHNVSEVMLRFLLWRHVMLQAGHSVKNHMECCLDFAYKWWDHPWHHHAKSHMPLF